MYSKINHFLQRCDKLNTWKAVHQLIDMIINEKPKHIRIPFLIGEAYGRTMEELVPAGACLLMAFSSIIVIDDLLDGDGRFSSMRLTSAELANMGAAMIAAAFQCIQEMSLNDAEKNKAASILSDMLFQVAHGQALDVRQSINESDYWEVASLKSGAFFSGAFRLGGVVSGVDGDDLKILGELGSELGILIQIHDDLRDSLALPADPDWKNGRHPLPILFAETVNHPWRERFTAIRSRVVDQRLLKEAQAILLRCGAISYGMDQIEQHYAVAIHLFDQLKANDKSLLIQMFDELRNPVERLLEEYGSLS